MTTTLTAVKDKTMGATDLTKELFGALNSYKRHRALKEIKFNDRQYHELQMYKMIDRIELAARAIQKAIRSGEVEMDDVELGDESND